MAQALPLLHLAVVPHARCEVHGEVIHARGETHAQPQSSTTLDPTTRAMQSSNRHDDDHEHEHCQALSDRRDGTCDQPAVADAARTTFHLTEVPCDASRSTGPRLYRLAPKLSPPHAA